VVTFVRSDLPTVAAEEGLTGLWKNKDSVGHVGSMHYEVKQKLAVEFFLSLLSGCVCIVEFASFRRSW